MSASKAGTLVITAADYYYGHHTAACVIEHHCKMFNKIVLTAVHPDRLEYCKKENVEVVKINPNDSTSYENAFKDADWVLFFTEPESGRVQSANRAIDAMKSVDVGNVIMISCESAKSTKHRYLAEFGEMEEKLCSTLNDYVIIRSAFIQNTFHLQAPYVTKHDAFPLTLSENVEFAPVNLDDEIEASLVIIKEGMEKHRGRRYHFTGPELVTGPKIAHELTQAIGGHKKITYKSVSYAEMEEYLKSLRDRIGHCPTEGGHHDHLKKEFKGQPTEHQIHTCLEEMDWLQEGNGKKSDDLKKILGKNGRYVEQFFGDHKNEFVSR